MKEKLKLKNYKPPAFLTKKVDLEINLSPKNTIVKGVFKIEKNSEVFENEITLNGDGQEILSLKINGDEIPPKKYLKGKDLVIPLTCQDCEIEVVNKIHPQENLSGEGIYQAGETFLSQCEAEGFRKIIYFQDRPDVLAKYTTTIISDKNYNSLLSNGNLIQESKTNDGKKKAVWEDPYPKPSYLFAIVCGNFDKIEDTYKTLDNRDILLEIYVDPGLKERAHHAMKSLKEAMKWDEERFELIYDLDRYMVVATNNFNSGAMENKGLNIFNSKYVLADESSATDQDFYNIQAVVGHEYFHNWTGNRVTCRDWFQLSLKEGLTVFRDQEFSSDLNSRAVKKIDDVITLKRAQFPEDQGPNAHPVRPEEAYSISNFYTATIYEKGSEIIRMIHTLLGENNFQKGMQIYFDLFDGKAVTTEDFCHAMEKASGRDLKYFQKWYSQIGTPKLRIEKETNEKLSLVFIQEKSPLLIPFKMGFLDKSGNLLSEVKIKASCPFKWLEDGGLLLELEKAREEVQLELPKEIALSLLRDFSAPIEVEYDYSLEELFHLAKYDTNSYSQWSAFQSILKLYYSNAIKDLNNKQDISELIQVYKSLLESNENDLEFLALLLSPMDYQSISLMFNPIPVEEFFLVDDSIRGEVVAKLYSDFKNLYDKIQKINSREARKLKGVLLSYLTFKESETASSQYKNASNMTDKISALSALSKNRKKETFDLLEDFYLDWKEDELTVTKYFAQVYSHPDSIILEKLKQLKNSVFKEWNPNHNYSVYGALSMRNPQVFHLKDGSAYKLMADRILELDSKNPSVAARLATCFQDYPRMDEARKEKMKSEIKRLLDTNQLSNNTYEILSNTLGV